MGKNKAMILIIPFLIILSYLGLLLYQQLNPPPNSNLPIFKLKIKNSDYQIEIASTPSQQSAGLSNRSKLCPNCGMIFPFSKPGVLPFWMKDTLIPLDMIWINSDSQIVDIQTASPQPNVNLTQLKIYQNQKTAQYVLELNAGDSAKLNLKVGDKIDLSSLKI